MSAALLPASRGLLSPALVSAISPGRAWRTHRRQRGRLRRGLTRLPIPPRPPAPDAEQA